MTYCEQIAFLVKCLQNDEQEEAATMSSTAEMQNARPRQRGWWLVPQPFDLVSSLLYLSVPIPYLENFFRQVDYVPTLQWWQATLMCVVIIALLLIDRLEYLLYGRGISGKNALIFIGVRITLIEVVSWLDRFRYSPFLYLIVLFLVCLHFGDIPGYSMAILAGIVYIIKHSYYMSNWLNNGTEVHYLVLFVVGCTFSITMGHVVRGERISRARAEALLAGLERSHSQLRDYAEQVEELTTIRERNRLARDIHDSLGHYLTVISVQLEKALVFRDQKPYEANQAVNDAKRLASEALQDVRSSVSTLRSTQEPLAFLPTLRKLVETMRSELCTIDLHIDGNESDFSQLSLQTLYRVIQEGLTNVQKHAKAESIWINLHFDNQNAILTVRDNGEGFKIRAVDQEAIAHNGCYGLQGLYERVELISGQMEVRSILGKGTTLHVTVPKHGYLRQGNQQLKV